MPPKDVIEAWQFGDTRLRFHGVTASPHVAPPSWLTAAAFPSQGSATCRIRSSVEPLGSAAAWASSRPSHVAGLEGSEAFAARRQVAPLSSESRM